jgi:hypothetical protein
MTTISKPITGGYTRSQLVVALYASVITFLTYASVYAFRKGFTICTFEGISYGGMSYKTWLVISQVLGYAASKFYGIRFIAEMKRVGRGKLIIGLTGVSWLALLLFAVIPAPINIIFLFINGFPLGMIWGVVFSFVEGRRATDFIGAALSVSFIFSSGFVKSVAESLRIHFQLSEYWVPFVTGMVFFLPLLLFVYLLEKIPAPSPEDVELRSKRVPMPKERRKEFLSLFLPGILAAVSIYVFSTLFRDLRDNFVADMWKEMGFVNQPLLFTKTETPTTIIILALIGSMILVKNNFRALVYAHYFIMAGFLITGISSLLFIKEAISPMWWMTLTGLGLYMTYIPFNCIFFERLIASFKFPGTVGFLIYVADSFGYLASVLVLITKEVLQVKLRWTVFYSNGVIIFSILGLAGAFVSLGYFSKKYKKMKLANG